MTVTELDYDKIAFDNNLWLDGFNLNSPNLKGMFKILVDKINELVNEVEVLKRERYEEK